MPKKKMGLIILGRAVSHHMEILHETAMFSITKLSPSLLKSVALFSEARDTVWGNRKKESYCRYNLKPPHTDAV